MRLDQSVSLGNLRLKLGDGCAEVTLYVHHSLADAQHLFRLLEELMSFYTDAVCGSGTGPVTAEPVPEPLEVVLAERGIRKKQRSGLERLMAAVFAYELPPSVRTTAGGNPALPVQVPVARCWLTEAETEALAAFCGDHRLSVHPRCRPRSCWPSGDSAAHRTSGFPSSIPSICDSSSHRRWRRPPAPIPWGSPRTSPRSGRRPRSLIWQAISSRLSGRPIRRCLQQSLLHFNLQYEGSPPGLPDIVMATDGGTVSALRTPPEVKLAALRTELFTASAAGVDLYGFLVFSGQLQIEHHAHAPAPDGTIDAIRSLLCSIPSDDVWMSE